MTANPIELIGGLTTTANVPKADIVAWAKARVPQVFADFTESRNTMLSGQLVITFKSTGGFWFQDTTDTTTADDGVSCIVSLDGKRFKPLSTISAPTLVSLGGVFASAAVPTQYVTGLDTAGNLLRAQPSAADLSDGNSGTGAVVHTAGAALSALTGLGIRSTGAAFDVKFASSEVLTATRTLALVMGDANRTISLAGDVTLAGALTTAGVFGSTFTMTGTTAVTFPTAGTLATRAGTETFANKSIDASANTVTNLTTAMFAANVVDIDGTFAANSDTRIASQKAVKTYVDTVAQGLDAKPSVVVATTANITLSGEQTIDGTLTSASRVLVKNQTTAGQNGVYVSGSGAWARATDANLWTELPGAFTFVETGTTNGKTGWVCTVVAGGTLGTTAITFTQFSGAGTYLAGTGLTLTGTTFAIDATVATLTGAQALIGKTYNGLTVTTSTGTLTVANGKTASISNTLTLTGTDGSSVAFGAGGTVLYSGGALGTPSSGIATNITGLPISSGLAGAGTGVLAAFAVNIGSAGAPVLFNGAGGTPSSLILTNATALPTAGLVNSAVDNTKLAQMVTATFKGRTSAGTGNPEDLTVTQATALLNAMVGDSGSGGTKGLVPAPGAGDAAALKVLGAGGTWITQTGSGGGSLADIDRQNILLESIYQSKLFAGYRRQTNRFSDGYKASDGINAGSSSGYSINTTPGNVAPVIVNRDALFHFDGTNGSTTFTDSGNGANAPHTITASGTFALSTAQAKFGTASVAVNGLSGFGNLTTAADLQFGAGDFTVEMQIYITVNQNSTAIMSNRTGGGGADGWLLWFGTTNNCLNVNSGSGAILADTTHPLTLNAWNHIAFTRAGSTGYLFVNGTLAVSGAMTNNFSRSTNFQIAGDTFSSAIAGMSGFIDELATLKGTALYTASFTAPTAAFSTGIQNMTLITTAQTADASVSNGRVLIEYDNTASPTLNTDLTVEVTCNGGTNWTSASLSSVSTNGQGGRKVAETVDQAATGGTSFAARIKTANNKNVPIYGVSLTVH